MRLAPRLLLVALLAAAASPAAGAEARPAGLTAIPDELPPVPAGFATRLAPAAAPGVVGAPFIRYSPETAWGFGAAGMLWFHADPVARAAGRASTVGAAFQQTTRRQTVGALQWEAYLAEGTWRSAGAFFVERWPYDFWGAGAAAGGAPERYTQRTLKLDATVARRVLPAGDGRGLWLGARTLWRKDGLTGVAPGGRIDGCAVDGCRGARVVGAQAVVAWDTRDRVCATEEGLLLAARAGGDLPALGGEVRAGELELDLRGWRRLPWRRAVLAAQARLQAVSGPVPFYLLPTFGGDRALRGVVEGRHRARASLVLQAELSVPLLWRLGLEVFGGVGEAAARPGAFSLRGLVPAGGAGLRFTVDPVERVFVRLDHGVARGSAQWYLSIGQAI